MGVRYPVIAHGDGEQPRGEPVELLPGGVRCAGGAGDPGLLPLTPPSASGGAQVGGADADRGPAAAAGLGRRAGVRTAVYNWRIADYHTSCVSAVDGGVSVWAHHAAYPTDAAGRQ